WATAPKRNASTNTLDRTTVRSAGRSAAEIVCMEATTVRRRCYRCGERILRLSRRGGGQAFLGEFCRLGVRIVLDDPLQSGAGAAPIIELDLAGRDVQQSVGSTGR